METTGHSCLVLLVFLDPVHMQICIKYEGSMTNHIGMRDNKGKKKITVILKIYVILAKYFMCTYTCAKYAGYEVSTIKTVDDTQFMIV